MITENMNSFGAPDPSCLFNIEKAVSQKTVVILLNITTITEGESTKFITECIQDPVRFNKSIRRQAICIFTTEARW